MVCAGGGNDVLVGLGGGDLLFGGRGSDRLVGGEGDDRLVGSSGADRLLAGPGSDLLEGGAGRDRLDGEGGVDTCLQGKGRGGLVSCERRWRPVVFATARGLELYEPAANPLMVTYHESLFSSAIALQPRGRMILNDNPRKFRRPPRTPGPRYIVMGSRGRPNPATSASDIVLRRGARVLSPVTGRVASVTRYRLYCEAPDLRVIIRADEDPDFTVVLFHLDQVRVRRGDRVVFSKTVLGVPRVFAGSTDQADTYVRGDHPHVHIEVERDGSRPIPGCRRARTTSGPLRTE